VRAVVSATLCRDLLKFLLVVVVVCSITILELDDPQCFEAHDTSAVPSLSVRDWDVAPRSEDGKTSDSSDFKPSQRLGTVGNPTFTLYVLDTNVKQVRVSVVFPWRGIWRAC
jgi:hypothetical protein